MKRGFLSKTKGKAEGDTVVSITELAWAVSKIFNYVRSRKRKVLVSNRGEIVAAIVPANEIDCNVPSGK